MQSIFFKQNETNHIPLSFLVYIWAIFINNFQNKIDKIIYLYTWRKIIRSVLLKETVLNC